jgi:hypothetical protein
LFTPLIGFHLVITLISKRVYLVEIKEIRRSDGIHEGENGTQKFGKAMIQFNEATLD